MRFHSFKSFAALYAISRDVLAAPLHLSEDTVAGLKIGPSIIEVLPSYRNIFPAKNFNRNISVPWWETRVLDEKEHLSVGSALSAFEDANFIVFNQSFYELLGVSSYSDNKTLEPLFIFPSPPSFANRMVHDATVYSPECHCIFFAELHPPKIGFSADAMPWIWRTNLNNTPPITEKVYPSPQLTMGNGATYYNGKIYWAQEGNYTNPGGIVRMDPLTLETEIILNNFLGHRFNSPNDIVITDDGIAFFTDGYYGYANFNDTLKPELANGVWRWDMKSGDLRQVAGAGTGIWLNPNGVALSPLQDVLYVTARGETSADPAGQRTIYAFDINNTPTSPALIFKGIHSYADAGFPDGIKVDSEGNVYGGVTGGVDVFSAGGELLGKIKVANGDVAVNTVFVGNWLYIAGREQLYRLELTVTGI